jgi:voltage-gated potassium channel
MSEKQTPWDLFILVISIFVVVVITLDLALPLSQEAQDVIQILDNFICAIFLADFFRSLKRAENRWEYFLRWGWLDLLSSIPQFEPFRFARLARVLRVIRAVRGLKGIGALVRRLQKQRTEATVSTTATILVLLIFTSSVLIVLFEKGHGPIDTAGEGIWWSMVTVTTVGYGDVVPVTIGGRIVATFLMLAGVGTFAALSGVLASWLLGSQRSSDNDELRKELEEMKAMISRLEEKMKPPQ